MNCPARRSNNEGSGCCKFPRDPCYQIPSCLASKRKEVPKCPPPVRKLTRFELEGLLSQDTCHHSHIPLTTGSNDDIRSWSLSSHCRRSYFLDQMGRRNGAEIEKSGPELAEIVQLNADQVHEMVGIPVTSGPPSARPPPPNTEHASSDSTSQQNASSESPAPPTVFPPSQVHTPEGSAPSPEVNGADAAAEAPDTMSQSIEEAKANTDAAGPVELPVEGSGQMPGPDDVSANAASAATDLSTDPTKANDLSQGSSESDTKELLNNTSGRNDASDTVELLGGSEGVVLPEGASQEPDGSSAASEGIELLVSEGQELSSEAHSLPSDHLELAGTEESNSGPGQAQQSLEGQEGLTPEGGEGGEATSPSDPKNEAMEKSSDPTDSASFQPCVPQTCAEAILMKELQKLTTQNTVLETKLGMLMDPALQQRRRSSSSDQSGPCSGKKGGCKPQSAAQAELLCKLAQLRNEKAQLMDRLEGCEDDPLEEEQQVLDSLNSRLEALQRERAEKAEKLKHLEEIKGVRDCQLQKIQNQLAEERKCLEAEMEKVEGELLEETKQRRTAEEEIKEAKEQLQRQINKDKSFLEQNLTLMRQLENLRATARSKGFPSPTTHC